MCIVGGAPRTRVERHWSTLFVALLSLVFSVLCPFGHLEKSIYCNIFSPLMSGFQYPTLKERKNHHVWQIINIALELKCNEKLSALLNVVVLHLPGLFVCNARLCFHT